MKYYVMMALTGLLCSTGAMAQTKDVKKDEKNLQNSIKDKKEDKHEAAKDLGHFRVKAAVKERKEVRHHRRSIHRQGKHLEAHGVKHPIKKAKAEVKEEKEIKKAKD